LILRKSSKTGANRCKILRLKCTKFDFHWGSGALPQTPLGQLTELSRPIAVFKGPTFKVRKGQGRERESDGESRGREGGQGEGRGREREGEGCPQLESLDPSVTHTASMSFLSNHECE